MAKNIDKQKDKKNNILAIVAVVILLASFVLYYLNLFDLNTLPKTIMLLAGAVITVFVFLQSEMGSRFKYFMQETKIEILKIVWPTKDETIKTTGLIIVAVAIVSIFLWLIDSLFAWLIRLITI